MNKGRNGDVSVVKGESYLGKERERLVVASESVSNSRVEQNKGGGIKISQRKARIEFVMANGS